MNNVIDSKPRRVQHRTSRWTYPILTYLSGVLVMYVFMICTDIGSDQYVRASEQ